MTGLPDRQFSPESQGERLRYHHLDAVRGFALLLGVFWHAAESFGPNNDYWAALDCSPSDFLEWFRFGCHSFRMELFFVIAGFFACMLIRQRGTTGFLRNRAQRILVPFIVGWILLYPLVVLLWIWGWSMSGRLGELGIPAAAHSLPIWKLDISYCLSKPVFHKFGTTYLWFLHQLLTLYAVMLICRLGLGSAHLKTKIFCRLEARVGQLSSQRGAAFLAAFCTTPFLLLMNSWTPDTPNQSFVPYLPTTLLFGFCFVVGWFLYRNPNVLHQLAIRWFWHLRIAGSLWVLLGIYDLYQPFQLDVESLNVTSGNLIWARIGYTAAYSIMSWSFVLGFLGLFTRFFYKPNAWVRYCSDASYWIYLLHFPLVVGLQIWVRNLEFPWLIKYAFINLVTLLVLFITYHYLVRGTALGILLNGRRYPRRWPWQRLREEDLRQRHSIGFPYARIDIALAALCILALGTISALYLYNWQLWYHSDYALVGLIGKHALDTGQCPIFVWKVGYQGMLLEGYLIALAFKLFGVSPMALDLVPIMFLFPMFYLLFKTMEASEGRRKAFVGTLFAIVSTPHFYAHFARTVPNYPETSCFGLALMLIYLRLVQSLYVLRSPVCFRHFVYFALFGLIAGFGFYTYGQIIYFVGAIALHLGMIYLRSLHCTTLGELIAAVCWSGGRSVPRYAKNLSRILCLSGIVLLDGAIVWLLIAPNLVTTRLGPIHFLALGFGLLGSGHLISWLASSVRNLHGYIWPSVLTANGFFIGFFPKFYYNFVLGGASEAKFVIGGSLHDIERHFGLAMHGLLRFTNLDRVNPITIFLLVFVTVGLLCYAFQTTRQIWNVVRQKSAPDEVLRLSPLAALPLCVIPAFMFSPNIMDIGSERYELILIYSIGLALGSIVIDLWHARLAEPIFSRLEAIAKPLKSLFLPQLFSLVLAILLLAHNCYIFYEEFSHIDHQPALVDTTSWLRKHHVQYGYAEYWQAYAITFLTQEEIILEPTSSNFIPYYADKVSAADRIAYVARTPASEVDGHTQLGGSRYRVLDKTVIRGIYYVYYLARA